MRLAAIMFALLLLIAIYVLFVRPLLERLGLVRALPAGYADWRDRIAGWSRHSATVLFGKLQLAFGSLLELAMQLGDYLNAPEIKEQLAAIGLGRGFAIGLMVLGVITILARLRTLPTARAA